MEKTKNILIAAILTLFIVACGGGSSNLKTEIDKLKKERDQLDKKIEKLEIEFAKSDTTKTDVATDIIASPVALSIFKSYIEVQGRVDADESVSLSSEMPGTVTKINVKVGDHVTKGQVLAETDSRAQQQQLSAAQINLSLATQNFERQKNLWEQKIGSEMQYLQAKTQKEAGEASISALQEQIRMGKIISPIDGTVDMVNLKMGQAVSPGFGVINVVNFSSLKVKADVAESYANRVKNNNEVLVNFPDMSDSVVGTVHYASRAINAMSRTFGVEVLLNGSKEYHPNTVAKLRINDYQSPSPVVVLPVKLIQKGTDESYVMVVEKGVAVKRVVKTGREYAGMAEVTSGIVAGDLVITLGYDMVNEGDKVTVSK